MKENKTISEIGDIGEEAEVGNWYQCVPFRWEEEKGGWVYQLRHHCSTPIKILG